MQLKNRKNKFLKKITLMFCIFEKNYVYLFFIALFFFIPRIFLIIFFNETAGDEAKYLDVANNILNNCGVSILVNNECVPFFGANGPGYSFFLATIFFFENNKNLALIVQMIFHFLSIIYLMTVLKNIYKKNIIVFSIGFILSISPITMGWTRFVLTETLMISLTIFLMSEIINIYYKKKNFWFMGLILLFMTFIRFESFLLLLPTIFFIFKTSERKNLIKNSFSFLLIIIVPWLFWTSRNYIKNVELIPNLDRAYELSTGYSIPNGYMLWTRTWQTNQYQNISSNFLVLYHKDRTENFTYEISIDDKIFRSNKEKVETKMLLDNLKKNKGKPFPKEIDLEFLKLAKKRIDDNKFYYYIGLPIIKSFNIWINPFYSFGLPIEISPKNYSSNFKNISNIFFDRPIEVIFKILVFTWFLIFLFYFIKIQFNKVYNKKNYINNYIIIFFLVKTAFLAIFTFLETRYIINVFQMVEIFSLIYFFSRKYQK